MKKETGVTDARANFAASKITIEGTQLSKEKLEDLGSFENIKVVDDKENADKEVTYWEKNRTKIVMGVSLDAILLAFAAEYLFNGPESLAISLFVTGTLLSAWENFKKGIANLIKFRFTMNTLMTVAIGGAFAIGYWEEAAVVALLFGVSEWLEGFTADKARQSIRELMDIAPKTATIIQKVKREFYLLKI